MSLIFIKQKNISKDNTNFVALLQQFYSSFTQKRAKSMAKDFVNTRQMGLVNKIHTWKEITIK
jgi:hypothetical protein